MTGLGTIINILCIVGGGLAGHFAGSRLKPSMQETVLTMTGIGVMVMGIGGALEKMLVFADGKLSSANTMMMIVSLALGSAIGEALQIEEKIVQFGEWLKTKSNSSGDTSFVNGFVTASCTVCIGAMAVIGAIQDGTSGNYSTLLPKGLIDAIIICIMDTEVFETAYGVEGLVSQRKAGFEPTALRDRIIATVLCILGVLPLLLSALLETDELLILAMIAPPCSAA